MANNIHELITREENAFKLPIHVMEGYEWSMEKHIRLSVLYKNSQYETGNNDDKPYKNIIRPITNLHYRTEGFDVKDIELFVDDKRFFYKSFLVRKFHDIWARKNKIDTFIDELVESYVDFGGVLVKNVNGVRPDVTKLQSIAFCDQTSLLSGALGIKLSFAPDELKAMEKNGWGNPANGATMTVDELLMFAEASKQTPANKQAGQKNATPGKYIEVYEVHGAFPLSMLKKDGEDDTEEDTSKYVRQMHIVSFYKNEKDEKQWVTLFKGKEEEGIFKALLRDEIYGRALGFGGIEELFEPQVWVNYDLIRMKGMLDAAAKIIYKTTDPAFETRNKLNDLENEEVLVLDDGKDFSQVDNFPRNLAIFEKAVSQWELHAQQMGSANDAIMGKSPSSGTPFKLQELVVNENYSLHKYRQGKIATFVDEIYQDWIIPHFQRELVKGQEFLSELSLEELQMVADYLVECEAEKMKKEKVLNGENAAMPEEIEIFKQKVRDEFMKGGSKRFIQIFKEEMKDLAISVRVNIVNKQKDLSEKTDKLTNIFRQIIANPAVLDDPRMANIFNQILEASGLSPLDFGYLRPKPKPQQLDANGQPVAPQQIAAPAVAS